MATRYDGGSLRNTGAIIGGRDVASSSSRAEIRGLRTIRLSQILLILLFALASWAPLFVAQDLIP
jgi:hypothetical protein